MVDSFGLDDDFGAIASAIKRMKTKCSMIANPKKKLLPNFFSSRSIDDSLLLQFPDVFELLLEDLILSGSKEVNQRHSVSLYIG